MSSSLPARVRHETLVVLKESLANIAKHAHARSVTVRLALNQTEVRLAISDDGRGFDPTRNGAGAGLRNLRERVLQDHGQFSVDSQPGKGTTLTACLPITIKENSSRP
jgi:signal transduction histidine kinase